MRLSILLIAAAGLALGACSSAPQVAPRFNRPSTAVIAQSHKSAISHVQSAKKKAVDLESKVVPALKLQVQDLGNDLDKALADLSDSEGARKQLDAQLEAQTNKANHLADDFDKAASKIKAQDAIIKQVNSYGGLGAFAYGFHRIVRNLLITLAVGAVLVGVLYGLSFAFPVIGVGLSFAVKIFRVALRAIHNFILAIELHFKPKPPSG